MTNLKAHHPGFIDRRLWLADLVVPAGASASPHVVLDQFVVKLIDSGDPQGTRLVPQHCFDPLATTPDWRRFLDRQGAPLALPFAPARGVSGLDRNELFGGALRFVITGDDGETLQAQTSDRRLVVYAVPPVL